MEALNFLMLMLFVFTLIYVFKETFVFVSQLFSETPTLHFDTVRQVSYGVALSYAITYVINLF